MVKTNRIDTLLTIFAWALLAACSATAPPPPTAPPPEPLAEPYPHSHVWTRGPEAVIRRTDGTGVNVPLSFTRLEVLDLDSIGLRVSCALCDGEPAGYIDPRRVIANVLPPEVAAWGSLEEFALSVREAASRRDMEALRPVMAADFTHSFIGIQTADGAFAVWQAEQFANLDEVPGLLDRGLSTRDGRIWAGPPEFVERVGFRGLRLGFRQRADRRWEWLYLVRGIVD